jgi:hypothetical protein
MPRWPLTFDEYTAMDALYNSKRREMLTAPYGQNTFWMNYVDRFESSYQCGLTKNQIDQFRETDE